MRNLYVMVGEPGSGKSTFIRNNHLDSLTLSSDKLRQLLAGVEIGFDANNEITSRIPTRVSGDAFKLLNDLLEARMKRGETLFVDATHLYQGAFSTYKKLRRKYNYRVTLIDMTHTAEHFSLDQLKERNAARDYPVPEDVLQKYWDRADVMKVPSGFNSIRAKQFEESTWWYTDNLEADGYKEAVVIGDVHSCYTALYKGLDLDHFPELDPTKLYIFVGDYLDRGLEHAKTFKFFYHIRHNKNVVFIRGNHEKHLQNLVNGDKIKNRGTLTQTFPALFAAGITEKMISSFISRLQDVYAFSLGGTDYFVSHAGVPADFLKMLRLDLSKNSVYQLGRVPESVFVDGMSHVEVGPFAEDVDDFEGTPGDVVQLHGHRNEFHHEALDNPYSINLEQSVERGGSLAIAHVTANGVSVDLTPNERR